MPGILLCPKRRRLTRGLKSRKIGTCLHMMIWALKTSWRGTAWRTKWSWLCHFLRWGHLLISISSVALIRLIKTDLGLLRGIWGRSTTYLLRNGERQCSSSNSTTWKGSKLVWVFFNLATQAISNLSTKVFPSIKTRPITLPQRIR